MKGCSLSAVLMQFSIPYPIGYFNDEVMKTLLMVCFAIELLRKHNITLLKMQRRNT